jgi:ubiquinone/menaquinone biosynthesis C-methylase UbiE
LWRVSDPGELWIDVGCGAGTYTDLLVQRGAVALGFDYSLPSLQQARSRYAGPSGWVVADGLNLPAATACADGVVCFGVMQAVSDSRTLIAELVRITKPGGQVWIDALNARFLPTVFKALRAKFTRRSGRLRFHSAKDIDILLRQNGAELVGVYRLAVLPDRLRILQRLINGALRAWPPIAPMLSVFCHALVIEARAAPHARERD